MKTKGVIRFKNVIISDPVYVWITSPGMCINDSISAGRVFTGKE